MIDIERLIAEVGGLSALARMLGVPTSTVGYWRSTGKIPSWRLRAVEEAAQRLAGQQSDSAGAP